MRASLASIFAIVEEVLAEIVFPFDVGDLGNGDMRSVMANVGNTCTAQKKKLAGCLNRIKGTRDTIVYAV
eukprot:1896803-Prorocentrum_lima.AAC.1